MTTPPAPAPALYIPESAMAVFAHPDDIEFSCAATLALWAKQGARISLVLLTSGDVGIARSDISRTQAAAIREAEASAAAKIIGAQEIIFLREPDGMLEATMQLRKRVVREIRRFRPEVLFAGDPQQLWSGDNYINHPDHRAAAEAAIYAVFPSAVTRPIFPELLAEGYEPHQVKEVYISGDAANSNLFVDISTTIERKIEALRQHKSQLDPGDGQWVREWAAEIGKKAELQYAEDFRVMKLVREEGS
jgi:LmbE family N-acetylglucosaminyl deacetylase